MKTSKLESNINFFEYSLKLLLLITLIALIVFGFQWYEAWQQLQQSQLLLLEN